MPARVIRGPELDKTAKDYTKGDIDPFAKSLILCLLKEKQLVTQRAEAAEKALNAVVRRKA